MKTFHSVISGVRLGLLATVIVPMLAFSTASASSHWKRTYNGRTNNDALNSAVLTPDGSDYYTFNKAGGTLTMNAASTNQSANLREAIWPADSPFSTNSQSCATWTSASTDTLQQGLMLRITDNGGDVRGITLTKNVIYGIDWVFNVHTWDSASSQPFTQIAQFDMTNVMFNDSQLKPLPWRVCARVTGNTLQFKIWFPNSMSEPSWTDPNYARSTSAIPADYVNAGQTGWYIGHIPASGSATYQSLTTRSLD